MYFRRRANSYDLLLIYLFLGGGAHVLLQENLGGREGVRQIGSLWCTELLLSLRLYCFLFANTRTQKNGVNVTFTHRVLSLSLSLSSKHPLTNILNPPPFLLVRTLLENELLNRLFTLPPPKFDCIRSTESETVLKGIVNRDLLRHGISIIVIVPSSLTSPFLLWLLTSTSPLGAPLKG